MISKQGVDALLVTRGMFKDFSHYSQILQLSLI